MFLIVLCSEKSQVQVLYRNDLTTFEIFNLPQGEFAFGQEGFFAIDYGYQ